MNHSANRRSRLVLPNARGERAAGHSAARAAFLTVFVFGVCVAGQGQKLRFVPTNKAEVLERAKDAPGSDQERAALIKGWFVQAGCAGSLKEQAVAGTSAANIVCELPGQGPESVIVGARYDAGTPGEKAIDNWDSASLLPALYECLSHKKRRHRFIFVAFADHGRTPAGSAFFAANMNASETGGVEGMVNLGALGLSPTKVWTSHSDKDMVQNLVVMAYALKLTASQVDLDGSGGSDSDPFATLHIPQITIHSLTRVNMDAGATPFQSNQFYDTYRLLCGYLSFLDVTLKPRPHSP
jgi:hypothetical protein